MSLAAVRSLGSARRLRTATELEDFEQELVDQYSLARAASGVTDRTVAGERQAVCGLIRGAGRPVWAIGTEEVDRYLLGLRRDGLTRLTVHNRAGVFARFFEFLIARYQGDIHALTGYLVTQPIDEYNRPNSSDYGVARVPPREDEVETLFAGWRASLPQTRKYLPAARDYLAASLWRRVGLRMTETVMLDIRDWRPDLGELGKLHVRFGKGSRGRGPKTRLVPAIDSVGDLLEWWLTDVRYQFGDDYDDPDAPLLPSERRDPLTGRCARIGDDALRAGLAAVVDRWLPGWTGKLSPHGLRHYCASTLYGRGMDLKAIQELLGHAWLSSTTRYVHVLDDHIEQAWEAANQRVATRLSEPVR